MIDDIVRLAAEVMEAYTVVFFRALDGRLHLAAAETLSKHLRRRCVLEKGEGLVGWIYREQKPVVAHNFHRDTRTLQFYSRDEGIKSFMGIPLADRQGVLCVDSKKNYRFTDKKIKIFNMIGEVITNEIKKEDSFVFEQSTRKKYEILYSIQSAFLDRSYFQSKIHTVLSLYKNEFNASLVGIVAATGYLLDTTGFSVGTVSDGGLVGLVRKNGTKLFMHGRHRAELFLFDQGPVVDNFCGVPLATDRFPGCLFLVKHSGTWHPSEVAIVEESAAVVQRFWREEND